MPGPVLTPLNKTTVCDGKLSRKVTYSVFFSSYRIKVELLNGFGEFCISVKRLASSAADSAVSSLISGETRVLSERHENKSVANVMMRINPKIFVFVIALLNCGMPISHTDQKLMRKNPREFLIRVLFLFYFTPLAASIR